MNTNDRKAAQLGMPLGTASHRLRKMVMFNLIKRLEEDQCYRCQRKIRSPEELSIDHKQDWLNVDPDLFWDLDNIAFSHLRCNNRSAPPPTPSHQFIGGRSNQEEDFWSYVDCSGECWVWQGHIVKKGNYPLFSCGGSQIGASRFAWTQAYGKIPPGKLVLHHCLNTLCVRPDHLWLGTHSDKQKQ